MQRLNIKNKTAESSFFRVYCFFQSALKVNIRNNGNVHFWRTLKYNFSKRVELIPNSMQFENISSKCVFIFKVDCHTAFPHLLFMHVYITAIKMCSEKDILQLHSYLEYIRIPKIVTVQLQLLSVTQLFDPCMHAHRCTKNITWYSVLTPSGVGKSTHVVY